MMPRICPKCGNNTGQPHFRDTLISSRLCDGLATPEAHNDRNARILSELRNPVRVVSVGFDRDWIVPAEVKP